MRRVLRVSEFRTYGVSRNEMEILKSSELARRLVSRLYSLNYNLAACLRLTLDPQRTSEFIAALAIAEKMATQFTRIEVED